MRRRRPSLSSAQRLLNAAITLLAQREPEGPPGFRRERLQAALCGGELAAHHLAAYEGLPRRQRGRA